VELVVPICRPWREFQEVTLVVREGGALAVGRTEAGFEERGARLEEVEELLAPYARLYDRLAGSIARALGVEYRPGGGGLIAWLRGHVSFLDAAGARWGRVVDSVGPFSVRRELDRVYIPYSGHALTLTYVAYPYRNAVVAAENRGRAIAIGSVVVEWGGVKVASAGLRTIAGALLLAQAAPELAPALAELRRALGEFVAEFSSMSPCR
jgi:hypothetical protein